MTSNVLVLAATRTSAMSQDPVRQELHWREAAGLPKPRTALDVLGLLESEPTPAEVIAEMLDQVEDFGEKWVEDYLEQFRRATQVKALTHQLSNIAREKSAQSRRASEGERFALLQEPISGAVARLCAIAPDLPAGNAALRPEVHIDAQTTHLLAEVRDILGRVGTMLGALPVAGGGGRGFLNGWALALLDISVIEPAKVKRAGESPLNPSAAREAVRRACEITSIDQLVVDVARGLFSPLRFGVVKSRSAQATRAEAVRQAHLVELVGDRW